MRLVMAGGTRDVSAWLEAETPEETAALRGCAARGEWTNGRGHGGHREASRPGGAARLPGRGPESPGAPGSALPGGRPAGRARPLRAADHHRAGQRHGRLGPASGRTSNGQPVRRLGSVDGRTAGSRRRPRGRTASSWCTSRTRRRDAATRRPGAQSTTAGVRAGAHAPEEQDQRQAHQRQHPEQPEVVQERQQRRLPDQLAVEHREGAGLGGGGARRGVRRALVSSIHCW